jgi:uncharacterized protein (DUF983 family)
MLRGTMSNLFDNPTPQFGTAEYAGVAGTEHCSFCKQPISGHYYRVNSAMACSACGERAQLEEPKDSHSRYVRGLIFGIGGAIIGLILYATFTIATGLIIGYVSLAVGYIVAKAIKMGSRGAGGRRYQITAAALTYAAVSLAAVPVYISISSKTAEASHSAQLQQQETNATAGDENETSKSTAKPRMGFGAALLQLVVIGLASPFLELRGDPFHGVIGLVILAVGIRIAWRIAAGSETQIYGPFETAGAASAGSRA